MSSVERYYSLLLLEESEDRYWDVVGSVGKGMTEKAGQAMVYEEPEQNSLKATKAFNCCAESSMLSSTQTAGKGWNPGYTEAHVFAERRGPLAIRRTVIC